MKMSKPTGPCSRIRARMAAVASGRCTDAVWRRPARMAPVDERPIRRAASAVCVRQAPDGIEVLVVERELAEEVGIALTADGFVDAADLTAADEAPPRLEQITPLCHWVAPPEVPVRFDARYFTIEGNGVAPRADGGEIARTWWLDPRVLLQEWERGDHKLYWPTWVTVREVAACATAAEAMGLSFEARQPTADEEASMPLHV